MSDSQQWPEWLMEEEKNNIAVHLFGEWLGIFKELSQTSFPELLPTPWVQPWCTASQQHTHPDPQHSTLTRMRSSGADDAGFLVTGPPVHPQVIHLVNTKDLTDSTHHCDLLQRSKISKKKRCRSKVWKKLGTGFQESQWSLTDALNSPSKEL